MQNTIKANFKQAAIKSGTATLQFEVLPSAKGFTDVVKMTGGAVTLTIESEQQELPLEQQSPTINIYNVNADTGEVEETEDAYLLPEGEVE